MIRSFAALNQRMGMNACLLGAAVLISGAALPDGDHQLFEACGLKGRLNETAFTAAITSARAHGEVPRVLAIADMTRPSSEQRLFVIDLRAHHLLLRTWVAHGKGSGAARCERVSNAVGSLCTCAGLMRVGDHIVSPKHGAALMLRGLDPGVNDKAEEREIIIHGAEYVGAEQVRANGMIGRSWGCPAVSPAAMRQLLRALPAGSLFYVHAARD